MMPPREKVHLTLETVLKALRPLPLPWENFFPLLAWAHGQCYSRSRNQPGPAGKALVP